MYFNVLSIIEISRESRLSGKSL